MIERRTYRYRILLVGGCVLFSALYVRLALQEFLASRAARRDTIGGLRRAVELSPENAEHHDRLAMALFFSASDWDAAQRHLQAATRLNPHDPRYWLDMGRLYHAAGDAEAAGVAADRAVATGGSYGWVLWEAGLLYLAQDKQARALRHFRQALEVDAIPAERVVEVCWRATRDTRLMLDLLPPRPAPYKALLDVLIGEGCARDADLAWNRLLSVGREFPPEISFGYIDSLLRQGRAADAAEAWRVFTSARRSAPASGNLVENGGFEFDLLNGGFDWRYAIQPAALVSLSSARAHSGRRSLHISFHADQLWDGPILQYIAVRPRTTYAVSAFVSTEDIWTGSGPRLQVKDAQTGKDYVLTREFAGSSPWTKVEAAFTTGPSCNLVTVAVVRRPGNSGISGTLWLDDVSLRESHGK